MRIDHFSFVRFCEFVILLLVSSSCGGGGSHGGGSGQNTGHILVVTDTSLEEGDGDGLAHVPVRLSSVANREVRFQYRTFDGTAQANEDYVATEGVARIPTGELETTIAIPVLGDGRGEQDETFTLRLSEPVGVSLPQRVLVVTILDDDITLRVQSNGHKIVTLSWDPVPRATSYQVLVNPDGQSDWEPLGDELSSDDLSMSDVIPLHRDTHSHRSYAVETRRANGSTTISDSILIKDLELSIGYFKASNPDQSDIFGADVAISGDGRTLAISSREASNATGIDGDQSDNSVTYAGAVYIFQQTNGAWKQQAYLKASNTGHFDSFGEYGIALSEDGDTLAVGAFGESSSSREIDGDQNNDEAWLSGAVYVFTRDQEIWTQHAYIKASNADERDLFGLALDLSVDGNRLAVGAPYEAGGIGGTHSDGSSNDLYESGAVYVFERSESTWSQTNYIKPITPQDRGHFGYAVKFSDDGTTLAIGSPNCDRKRGKVYIFQEVSTGWTEQAIVRANHGEEHDHFGKSLSLSGDGSRLAVGAYFEDSGASGVNGDPADNSVQYSGAAYVFDRMGSSWNQVAYLKAQTPDENDRFGMSVALTRDGNELAVGAFTESSKTPGVGGDDSDNEIPFSGAVYLFDFRQNAWHHRSIIKAPNPGQQDLFGRSLVYSGDGQSLIVSGIFEDGSSVGFGGDLADDSLMNAGAAYVY